MPWPARRRGERAEHALRLEERRARRHGAHRAAAACRRARGRRRTRASGAAAGRRHAELQLRRGRPRLEGRQFLGRVARGLRLPVRRHLGRGLRQHPLALQLALVGREVRLRRGRHQRHLTADEALGSRRPRRRRPRNGELLGGHGREVELVVRPPALEAVAVHPRLDLHVDQAVFLQLRDRPFGGLLRHRRPGQPRRVHVREPARQVHHLRALQALGLDLVDVDVIQGLAAGLQDRSAQDGGRGDGAEQVRRRHACSSCSALLTTQVQGNEGIAPALRPSHRTRRSPPCRAIGAVRRLTPPASGSARIRRRRPPTARAR